MSAITRASGGGTARMNSEGESHCFNCGATNHWAYECPQLTTKQQGQLHMNLEEQGEGEDQQEEAHQLLNVALLKGEGLPDNHSYLDRCSTVMAFKTYKFLKGLKMLPTGIKINCSMGVVKTSQMGSYGSLNVWYLPDKIRNIFSMH